MSDSGLDDFYSSENAHNWEQLHNFHENRLKGGAQWVFRGQGNHSWGLTSSLERQVTNLGLDQSDAPDIERGLLRRFKRQCHQYVDSVPRDNERLEWMALMQHHGAPTRILD